MDIRRLLVTRIHSKYVRVYGNPLLKGTLLDLGCGRAPFRGRFDRVRRHVGLDTLHSLHGIGEVDAFGDADHLPFGDGSIDSILATAVLEHVQHPLQVLRECSRVLKPGGTTLVTAPFIWHIHEAPHDYFRFSRYGLARLFEEAGFQPVKIRAMSGFCVTFAQMLVYFLYRFNRGIIRLTGFIPALALFIQCATIPISRLDHSEEWTWMYLVTAHKPDDRGSGPELRSP